MKQKTIVSVLMTLALMLCLGQGAMAQNEWKFGIGTGISTFSLDGDLGFVGPKGEGVIIDVDLDNSDTQDMFESGFGLGGFAAKGKWKILYMLGTATLEDKDPNLGKAEWDRTQVEVAGVYNFGKTGNHVWGVLFGVRNIEHEWKISDGKDSISFDENWTDGLIGITHAVPFAGGKWAWTNRLDGGFGDSEGSYLFVTTLNWQAFEHWAFNFNVKTHSIEFGDMADIDKSDFYLYDIDETGAGIGFLFTW